ncbi:MAG TPA: DUF5946 family protein [Candidatus Saccharimonadales bacterium]|nr:DUF5946 family protein [Candidatus Saccharimonadales bacterium]
MNLITCTGCGITVTSAEIKLDNQYHASYACVKLYEEISADTLSLHDKDFIHQLIVDTYTAQHVGAKMKPIMITFALIGLYLTFEHNYTGKQVQSAHILLANQSKEWPSFIPPKEKASITVLDIVQNSDSMKQEMIKKWGKAVWGIWQPEHENITKLVKKYLEIY